MNILKVEWFIFYCSQSKEADPEDARASEDEEKDKDETEHMLGSNDAATAAGADEKPQASVAAVDKPKPETKKVGKQCCDLNIYMLELKILDMATVLPLYNVFLECIYCQCFIWHNIFADRLTE